MHLAEPCVLDGGYSEAERRAAVFGGERAPICCLEIAPAAPKFAEELTHRDYLGSLMGLGLLPERTWRHRARGGPGLCVLP